MVNYINADGLSVSSGAQDAPKEVALSTSGARKELVITLDFDKYPNAGVKQDSDLFVPAGAVVESSKTVVTESFAGGTSVTFGFYNKAGTAIDADGLDAAVATAALTAGAVIVNDGALAANSVVSTTQNAYIGATQSGTFTAGKAKVLLTYFVI